MAGLKAHWSPEALASLRALLQVIDARASGKTRLALRFDPAFQVGRLAPDFIGAVEVLSPGEALCRRVEAHEVARAIAGAGGGPVRTIDASFVYRTDCARFDAFAARLDSARTP